MNLVVSIALFVVGLGLVVYFAEKLVKGTVGMSLSFGISAFLISVIFIGFDPENLALGGVVAYEGVAGIALGSIIGATMVAIALAFGIPVSRSGIGGLVPRVLRRRLSGVVRSQRERR